LRKACTIVLGDPEIATENPLLLRYRNLDIEVVSESEGTRELVLQSISTILDVDGLLPK